MLLVLVSLQLIVCLVPLAFISKSMAVVKSVLLCVLNANNQESVCPVSLVTTSMLLINAKIVLLNYLIVSFVRVKTVAECAHMVTSLKKRVLEVDSLSVWLVPMSSTTVCSVPTPQLSICNAVCANMAMS